ncbi:MAG: hypothetical protein IIC67_00285 [Thaumarchaeota archaeon]|nr:hypothetical protein [Nitrososphaerota archaeon]
MTLPDNQLITNIINGYTEILTRVLIDLAKYNPELSELRQKEYVAMNTILIAQCPKISLVKELH